MRHARQRQPSSRAFDFTRTLEQRILLELYISRGDPFTDVAHPALSGDALRVFPRAGAGAVRSRHAGGTSFPVRAAATSIVQMMFSQCAELAVCGWPTVQGRQYHSRVPLHFFSFYSTSVINTCLPCTIRSMLPDRLGTVDT